MKPDADHSAPRSPDGRTPTRTFRAEVLCLGVLLVWLALGTGSPTVLCAAPDAERGNEALRVDPSRSRLPRILILFSGDRLSPANITFEGAFRRAIVADPGNRVECSEEFLDEVNFPVRFQERMGNLLREKYGSHPPNVIVAFASPSLDLCLRYRAELFRDVPIVYAALDADPLSTPQASVRGVTGVRSSIDGAATLHLALRLHPRTRNLYLIADPTRPDTSGVAEFRRLCEGLRIPVHTLAREPFPALVQALSSLPEHSVVINLVDFANGPENGEVVEQKVRRESDASSSPVYGMSDPLVGFGLVGAVTTPIDSIGRASADMVRKVLSRSDGRSLPEARTLAATPLFDWRELRRWHIRKNQLPVGSVVRFESRSFWRQYWLLVTTWGGLFLLQSGLILALVLQSRRRRRAELEASRRREELAHMTRVATMGELTASLAHEINQPLAAILSNAQAGLRLLGARGVPLDEIRDILADIAADDMRAGEVIRRMRDLLRKGEFHPTTLDLNDLVEEVVGIVHGEMILQNVSLSLDLSPRVPPVHGDRVQLQQVLLNLMMNALDAMKEIPDGNRRVSVRSAPSGPSAVEISVEDSGVGIPGDKLEQCFEPFVTTKAHGMGLGLSICRSIIQAHGGRIGSMNNSGRGATFWFTLPAVDERQP